MIEQIGNLWDFHKRGEWICITTNGFVKKNGEAVMGRGCAYECKLIYPQIPLVLGNLITEFGNEVFIIGERLLTFPVKHNWWEKADPFLIMKSCSELVVYVDNLKLSKIYLPRPGCGNGKLSWENQVKHLCQKYLDDRFIVLTKQEWVAYEDDYFSFGNSA